MVDSSGGKKAVRSQRRSSLGLWVALGILLAACGPVPSSGSELSGQGAPGQRSLSRQRMTAAFMGEIVGLSSRLRITGPSVGLDPLEEMLNAGFVIADRDGALIPQLAEAVPSTDSGLWRVFPDGRMETTWKIKAGARWHDGAAFTAGDALFTTRVDQDRDVPIARPIGYSSIESVEAPDARTLVVRWSQPFIDADRMFTREFAFPLPKHLLEDPFLSDKANLLQHPYWTTEYVGTGAFKLREFVRGSHLVLEANDQHILGRPNIDEIEVKLIPDSNTLVANILAGAVEMTLGHSLSVEQATQVRDLWPDGKVEMAPGNWVTIHPQLLNSAPGVVANLQFRRALLHSIDRQQLVDALMYGASAVAHSFLNPNQPQYNEIERGVIRYEYDPRKATQMIEGLGYAKGPDGLFRADSSARDAASQRLLVELRTTAQYDVQRGAMLAVADYWQRVGVSVETLMVPTQRQRDGEYRATFPAFELLNGPPSDVQGLAGLHSSRARVPENNFVGSNYPRYINPEFDALLDKYFVTIPRQERLQVLGQIIHHISDQLISMGLFYNDRPILIGKRLQAVAAPTDRNATQSWNAHQWKIKS